MSIKELIKKNLNKGKEAITDEEKVPYNEEIDEISKVNPWVLWLGGWVIFVIGGVIGFAACKLF
ncbi:hypothetical protein [Nitrosomonas sp. Nm34]|uniref:hypothetical protein n=1 Tax=Nitrosomonas sp. Nm34 TaxID=1881055 RepID=UPI0008E835AB|nr:hypothetical protein [Nitrosomonas sp. Nm34]SFI94634.1 hypothetical protein SAMN05428978_10644 [Nitrosomonas sp. Nm34]